MKLIGAALLLFTSTASVAVPPAPANPPAALVKPIDGYDMSGPYQIWRFWVESQKGPVTEEVLGRAGEISGLKPLALLLHFKKYNDFGHYMTGEIRSYCRTVSSNNYGPVPGSCRYVLRRAYVPMDAEAYEGSNPVAEWTRANFKPQALARHFREVGLGPDTDWWMADSEKMFATAPSPRPILANNAVVVRLDSLECPQMGRAIEALEGSPLGVTIDLPTVGSDAELVVAQPHSITSIITFQVRNKGAPLSLEGSGGRLEEMIQPILAAADGCEAARKR